RVCVSRRAPTCADADVWSLLDARPEFIETLRASLDGAATDGILLSGGLDTSAIAAYAAQRPPPLAVTVCVSSGEPIDSAYQETLASKLGCDPSAFPAPDAPYAEQCAHHLGLSHDLWWLTLDELLSYAPRRSGRSAASIRCKCAMGAAGIPTWPFRHGSMASTNRSRSSTCVS